MNAPEGVGRCTECGRTGPGRLVGEVEQGNAAGCTAVVCDTCDKAKPTPAATRSRVEAQLAKFRRGNG